MQRISSVLGVLALHAVAQAAPQPQITHLIADPGIQLGHSISGAAFCDTSMRAALVLQTGEVVGIDAAGTKTPLGNIGAVGPRASVACDARDRVVVARKGELLVLDAGAVSTVKAPIGAPIGGRTLDDGTVAFVSNGMVVHWDGTQVDDWSFTPPPFLERPVLSGDGRALVGRVRGQTTVFDAGGTSPAPPRMNGVVWAADNQALVGTTAQGLVRWKLGAADVTVLDPKIRGFQVASAGKRVVVTGMSAAQIIELDAQGVTRVVASTRWPAMFPSVVGGKADFAVVTADRAAYVLDLTKAGALIDDRHATATIRSLAFSPDGAKLVFAGTPQELTVADARSGAITERLPIKAFGIDQLRWTRDAIIAGGFRALIKWSRDNVTEGTKAPTEGLDEAGLPVDGSAACGKLPPDPMDIAGRGPPAPIRVDAAGAYFAASCRQGLTVFRTKDLAPVATTTERVYAFALVGARAFYAKGRDLHVVDAKGDRVALTLPSATAINIVVASRKRLAIATNGELVIVDTARLVPVMSTPAEGITGVAWSPDGRRLAVAAQAAIDLWTLPRP